MYKTIQENGVPIKAWVEGVPLEDAARRQLLNVAALPFIHHHVAAMPDVHFGKGATVGSVIPTKGAIIPAAVGVDIGCGMMAMRTSLTAGDLPDGLADLRSKIERAVPHGGQGANGGWGNKAGGVPASIGRRWRGLEDRFKAICEVHRGFEKENALIHLGSLGGGNHFIELCLDESDRVWVMLHSGSRGIGNAIGRVFIEKAREMLARRRVHVPDHRPCLVRRKASPPSTNMSRRSAGRRTSRVDNREAMMERTLARAAHGIAPVHDREVGGQLPPQLRRAREPFRRERMGDA